ncbi:MAG TPA: HD domain-containing phosphohydrolase [Gemmatimonadaceae bacterium]|nr:HD domain-containing phosphohydrolase [Gemmatimonadaceae bacterium]
MPRLSTLLAAGLGAALLAHARQRRDSAERFAAALFETLLNAIDANDAETGRHVRRVARYALVLADAAGLSSAGQREVEWVALFHDIGKIHEALFDAVHDAHELTQEERAAIATHPQRGAQVLAPLIAFYPGLPLGVVAHHERWDGTGYPRGLSGRAIPLAARIVTIADSFDAVTHQRRYRRGRSLQAGFDAIRAGAGTQFDPALTRLFLRPDVRRRVRAECASAEQPVDSKPGDRREPADVLRAPPVAFRWRTSGLAQVGESAPERAP